MKNKHIIEANGDIISDTAKVFQWTYDDHQTTGTVCQIKSTKVKIFPAVLTCYCDRNTYNKRVEKLRNKNFEITEKSLDIPSGIKEEIDPAWDTLPLDIDMSAKKQLFENFFFCPQNSDAEKRSLISITSTALSSYLLRFIIKNTDFLVDYGITAQEFNSPYVTIDCCYNPAFLRQLCDALCVCVDNDSKHLSLHCPTVMPPNNCPANDILDCAWLSFNGSDYRWPACYRDTCVFLDARVFRIADIKQFARLNPWCSCIIFGKHIFNMDFRAKVEISGENLANFDCYPELKILKFYINRFVIDLKDFVKQRAQDIIMWRQLIQREIASFRAKKGGRKVTPSSSALLELQLLSLRVFFDYCEQYFEEEDVSSDAWGEKTWKICANSLLPGVFDDDNEVPPSQPTKLAADLPQLYNAMINAEGGSHFLELTHRGESCPEYTAEGQKVWGYYKKYQWQQYDDEKTPCVVIFRDAMFDYAEATEGINRGSVEYSLEKYQKKLPIYVHKTMNARIKRDANGPVVSVSAFRINLNKLPKVKVTTKTQLGGKQEGEPV